MKKIMGAAKKSHQMDAFCVWLFLSPLYYLPNLISGQLLQDRSEDYGHKIFKYLVAAIFSFIFLIYKNNGKYLFQTILFGYLIIGFLALTLSNFQAGFGLDALIVILIFTGFTHFTTSLDDYQLGLIAKTVVVSAIIPASISYFEHDLFNSVLSDFWSRTGGFRSVSTLLNPNNYGIFLGCCLIILFFSNLFNARICLLLGTLFTGALLLSGSRTAMVALVAACLLGGTYRGYGRIRILAIFGYFGLFFLGLITLIFLIKSGMLAERILDPLTAIIRLEKYFEFLINFDSSYLIPDFNESRVAIVSESGYFHLINSLGLIIFIGLTFSLLIYFRPSWLGHLFSNHPGRYFDVLIFYFLTAMLFENVLMSFPNNQLMFIAIGGSLAYYKIQMKCKCTQ